jgi:hypothetical protein
MVSKIKWMIIFVLIVSLLAGCIPNTLLGSPPSAEDEVATQVEATVRAHAAASSVAATIDAQGGDVSPPDTQPPDAQPPPPEETPTPTNTQPPPIPTLGPPMVFVTTPTNCRTGPGMENYKKIGGLLLDEETEVVGLPPTEMDFAVVNNPDAPGVCWLYLGYANMSYSFLKQNYPHLQTYSIPDPDPGSIAGIVWNDHCSQFGGSPPPGCLDTVPYKANGTFDSGETGFSGVLVELGSGACPSTGLATTLTNASGGYSFNDVLPGNYCVSIDPLNATNIPILIPGGWTYPNANGRQDVTVGPAESVTGISFGWDWQND